MMTRTELTITLSCASAFDTDGDVLWDGDYLAYVIAAQSYRRLRKFITRHVAPRADARIRRLVHLSAEERARILSNDPRAMDAWAVAIWSWDLDREAAFRLWTQPDSPSIVHPSNAPTILDRDAVGMELMVKAPNGRLRVAQADWVLRHATLATLRHRFARARALAIGMARAGDAELGQDMTGANKLAMTGEVLHTGALQFTVDAEPMCGTLATCPHLGKEHRRMADESSQKRRLAEIKTHCAGPCLRFSWEGGWGVASSSVPDLAAGVTVKRHRLFAAGRPVFLLFATQTGWCARMEEVPLEVHDEVPCKVIDTLRHAYARYKKQQDERARGSTA